MSSLMRALLGTGNRFAISNEEITNCVVDGTPSTEDTTVVMKGPLADVYSDALMKTLDKDNPLTNDGQGAPAEPDAAAVDTTALTANVAEEQNTVETAIASSVGSIVLESQAIDAVVSQSLAEALADEAPADPNAAFETIYAIDETQVNRETVKDVTAILAEAENPDSVTVLIDNVVPPGAIEQSDADQIAAAKELSIGLESIVVGMGGKVVHSYKELLESRRK